MQPLARLGRPGCSHSLQGALGPAQHRWQATSPCSTGGEACTSDFFGILHVAIAAQMMLRALPTSMTQLFQWPHQLLSNPMHTGHSSSDRLWGSRHSSDSGSCKVTSTHCPRWQSPAGQMWPPSNNATTSSAIGRLPREHASSYQASRTVWCSGLCDGCIGAQNASSCSSITLTHLFVYMQWRTYSSPMQSCTFARLQTASSSLCTLSPAHSCQRSWTRLQGCGQRSRPRPSWHRCLSTGKPMYRFRCPVIDMLYQQGNAFLRT